MMTLKTVIDCEADKVIEKDGRYQVIMPNGFQTQEYDSIEKCYSFLGIVKTSLDVLQIFKIK